MKIAKKSMVLTLVLLVISAAPVLVSCNQENQQGNIPKISQSSLKTYVGSYFSFNYPDRWELVTDKKESSSFQLFYLVKPSAENNPTDYFLESDFARIFVDFVPQTHLKKYILSPAVLTDNSDPDDPDPILSFQENTFLLDDKKIVQQSYESATANGYKIYLKYNDSHYLIFTAVYGTWNPLEDLKLMIKSLKRIPEKGRIL